MNQLWSVLFSALRARVTSLWTMLRLIVSPTFWSTRGVNMLRGFFMRLLDVKPRNKRDYYSVLNWLVSKRLAFALVVVLGVVSLWYVFSVSPLTFHLGTRDSTIHTYKYRSPVLKFYNGDARILDADNKEAFVGAVSGGRANGLGKLYDGQGNLMYSGEFKDSMYEGQGETYYQSGVVQYSGSFSGNRFNGDGSYFRPEGTLEYEGSYVNGVRQGAGEIYNAGGNMVFSGHIRQDHIVYEEFIGKTAPEAAAMYAGSSVTYTGDDSYCVDMNEIGAVYEARSGEESVDEEWQIERIYALSDVILLGGREMNAISDIAAALGDPTYLGETRLTMSDAVSVNLARSDQIEPVDIELRKEFEDAYTVTSFDENRQIYIYVFENNGFVYTFYCESSSATGFFMYSAE
jgi:hypothetical protein